MACTGLTNHNIQMHNTSNASEFQRATRADFVPVWVDSTIYKYGNFAARVELYREEGSVMVNVQTGAWHYDDERYVAPSRCISVA